MSFDKSFEVSILELPYLHFTSCLVQSPKEQRVLAISSPDLEFDNHIFYTFIEFKTKVYNKLTNNKKNDFDKE
jgi:hypothetical protein